MRFRVFTEPQQGAEYEQLLAVAQTAERLGFDAFFRSDHLLAMAGDGLPGPSESWTSLAGIARETERIRLGTLVTSATFRHPSILAIQVAQVDRMSRGRVELGLGTGWFEGEHTAYGIPFPAKRFGLLEEQLEIVTGLWGTPVGSTFDFRGEHYELAGAPGLPKPAQEHLPVIIGGGGPSRTPALAARFADEYNVAFRSLDDTAAAFARARAACEASGREPGGLRLSVAQTVAVGADDAEAARRAAAVGRAPEDLRANGFGGTVPQVVDRIGAFAELGADTVYLQLLDLSDLDQLELLAAEVVPAFS